MTSIVYQIQLGCMATKYTIDLLKSCIIALQYSTAKAICVSQREGLQRKAHSKGGTTAARTCSVKPDAARFLLAAARPNYLHPPQKIILGKINLCLF